tara:strand:- start:1710 stop:2123 length:414 start_codon:yes stop_codon:yes gene_type:complete
MVDLLPSVILHQLLSVLLHQLCMVIQCTQATTTLLQRYTGTFLLHHTAIVFHMRILNWINGAHIGVLGVLNLVLLSMASALLDLVTLPLQLHLPFQSVSVKAMTSSDITVATAGERIAIGAMRVGRTGGSTGVADVT